MEKINRAQLHRANVHLQNEQPLAAAQVLLQQIANVTPFASISAEIAGCIGGLEDNRIAYRTGERSIVDAVTMRNKLGAQLQNCIGKMLAKEAEEAAKAHLFRYCIRMQTDMKVHEFTSFGVVIDHQFVGYLKRSTTLQGLVRPGQHTIYLLPEAEGTSATRQPIYYDFTFDRQDRTLVCVCKKRGLLGRVEVVLEAA